MSIAGCDTSACQSSPMCVAPLSTAASRLAARVSRVAPADAREVAARAVGREVGDADEVHARRARDLRQVHRAELAGADQADADRLAVGLAPQQLRAGSSGNLRASRCGIRLGSGPAAHAAIFSSSLDVSSALAGMPFFHGRSTG
jgi:hypothetical protein